MYLSRIRLASRASALPEFWEKLSSPYGAHQAVWGLFADDRDRRRDFLYRLDVEHGRPRFHTLSHRPPLDPSGIWRVETKRFAPELRAGDRLAFMVRVNPTVRRDGKRHDVVMDAKRAGDGEEATERVQKTIRSWLEKRMGRAGFVLRSAWVEGHRVVEFRKAKGRRVRLAIADVRGELEVVDSDRFRGTLFSGLGPAKSFGCGLLMIRRA